VMKLFRSGSGHRRRRSVSELLDRIEVLELELEFVRSLATGRRDLAHQLAEQRVVFEARLADSRATIDALRSELERLTTPWPAFDPSADTAEFIRPYTADLPVTNQVRHHDSAVTSRALKPGSATGLPVTDPAARIRIQTPRQHP